MAHDILASVLQRRKVKQRSVSFKEAVKAGLRQDIPNDLVVGCPSCKASLTALTLQAQEYVCPECSHHFRLKAEDRLAITVDAASFIEKGRGFITLNPLFQEGYEKKIQAAKQATHLDEAYVYGYATIEGEPCIVGVMDSHFMMGSMGSVVGEKVTKSIEYAIYKNVPLVIFVASGGARMQEGIYSLMQMAKTASALKKLDERGLCYISVLTDPTTGGVTASFASLGDIILAEPKALIGFAGPRVIEQTIKETLPEGFQRAEFMQAQGMVDAVVNRHDMRPTLGRLLRLHAKEVSAWTF